jgi:P2 family phage contractile tail tube protein
MTMQLPPVLKNMKVYENGTEFIGAGDVQLPSLKLKVEKDRQPGQQGPVEYSMHVLEEVLVINITSSELRASVLGGFDGQCQGLRTLNLRQIYKNLENCENGKHNIVAVGFFKELDFGAVKLGEKRQIKYAFSCHKFRYEINGTVIFDYDVNVIKDPEERSFLG